MAVNGLLHNFQSAESQPQTAESQLCEQGQGPLADHLRKLAPHDRCDLHNQIDQIDWKLLQSVFADGGEEAEAESPENRSTLVLRPVRRMIRQPRSHIEQSQWKDAARRGAAQLSHGRVAAVMVAGGQGTRLGFDQPKGMFPIGPLSQTTLYEWCCDQLHYRMQRHVCSIPYIIMTSDATDAETREFFETHEYFGLDPDEVWFVKQGNLPAFDRETGHALLADETSLALSPDGHGGLIEALTRHGIWDRLRERGIETLVYHQVDNPLTRICDPAFIGWHLMHRADVSTKVARKRSARERMGAVMEVNGVPQVVEYSDLSEDVASLKDDDGELRFWAGNTAMHVFNVSFLESFATAQRALPLHLAHKAVPFWADGRLQHPTAPNAVKFERFIFDVLPQAQRPLFVEIDRDAEFQPVKNRAGDDSPATSRAAMMQLHRKWLQQVGVFVPDEIPVEISPLFAQEASDLRDLFPGGTTLLEPLLLSSSGIPVLGNRMAMV